MDYGLSFLKKQLFFFCRPPPNLKPQPKILHQKDYILQFVFGPHCSPLRYTGYFTDSETAQSDKRSRLITKAGKQQNSSVLTPYSFSFLLCNKATNFYQKGLSVIRIAITPSNTFIPYFCESSCKKVKAWKRHHS